MWEEDRKTVFKGLERLKDYPECMWVSQDQPHRVTTGVRHPFGGVSRPGETAKYDQKQRGGLWPAFF